MVAQKGKPHGRLVCDYRRVNTVTKRMYHPMPSVMEVIRLVTGAELFSGLDAVSGFNQLRLTEAASEKLAITVPSGLCFWTGNSPSCLRVSFTFRRLFTQRCGI